MAGNFNKFVCVGRLTRDPELRALTSGKSVCKFTVAVDRRGGTRDRHETDFFDVTAWEKLAETCNTYLTKGMQVLVEGRIQIRSYEDRDGVKRKAVDVIANDMQMLDRSRNGQRDSSQGDRDESYRTRDSGGLPPQDDLGDDEIPFE